jgi:cobalt-zinc-cadmium efflux system protein
MFIVRSSPRGRVRLRAPYGAGGSRCKGYRHGVGHGHHHEALAPNADRRWLGLALGLVVAFMVAEVVAGILADSLALLSDASHMLTDAAAIALALAAARLAARPAGGKLHPGLCRA